ncbi:MAG: hypothetical protein CTR53_05040 [Ferrovibrio sp.]|jgi:hypothetical protein|nr:MAG: hypothetical protein CTR53_05040 [Ferrovibrio sp.]
MTAGMAKALRILVAIGLLLGPLAPMTAYCAPQADTGSVTTDANPEQTKSMLAGQPGHDCCDELDQVNPDGKADLAKCKVGCIAIPGLSLPAQSRMPQPAVTAVSSSAIQAVTDWLPPPLYDPPIFRS